MHFSLLLNNNNNDDDFVSTNVEDYFLNGDDEPTANDQKMSEDIPNLHISHGNTIHNSHTGNGSHDTLVENCSSPLDNIHFEDPLVVGSLIPLGLVCLVVILGNMMVIIAVFNTHKLRGATYLFIVSLACADLMLGLVILPFSAMYEVFSLWIFGSIWCDIWLAVDVWMCTASILHLVVISLDRYIAVTHPITYPNIMTSKRAKMLICGAWVLSFVICFPPLVGWNDQRQIADAEQPVEVDPIKTIMDRCRPQCVLNQEPGYVIYSAVGSFYAPMLVMMFFNWRIYRTARKTTRAIRQGWTKVKGVGGDDEIGMGIHRGGSHSSSVRKTTTIVSSNGMVGTKISTGSTRSTNGVNVTVVRGNGPGLSTVSGKSGAASRSSSSSTSARTVITSNGLKPRMNSIPRSASCQLVNKDESNHRVTTERAVLAVSEKSLLSPNGSNRARSKSVALSGRPQVGNFLTVPDPHDYNAGRNGKVLDEDDDDSSPRLSQHQPCPNHIAGKTFSERGTQTLAKQKAEMANSAGTSATVVKKTKGRRGCLALRCPSKSHEDEMSSETDESAKPLRLTTKLNNGTSSLSVERRSRGFESSWRRSKSQGEDDVISVGSGHHQRNSSSKTVTCFECHPRRWRHRTPKMFDILTLKRFRQKRRRHSSSIGGGSMRINLETPSLLNLSLPGSTDELRAMGGVAAMIGSVVNHSASLAVAAGGVPVAAKQNRTFGRRNIKNQVRRFRVETKAAKTLGIIVGCFIVCWFPFFTMYLVTAFCEDCIPPLVFSIFFWLGYCNSAVNPFIYAMFSREFRGAFKKILCRLFCRKVNEEPNRRGVFMAFHGAATAAAVVTAAGTRNVQAVGACAAAGKNTNCIFNSEAGSGGGGGFHSTASQGSRRNSVMMTSMNK